MSDLNYKIKVENKNLIDQNKKFLFCLICKSLIQTPTLCSTCKQIFCRKCILNYLTIHNTCPNNCSIVELLNPTKDILTSYLKETIRCIACGNEIPSLKYDEHFKKCSKRNNKMICFNCASEIDARNLLYLNIKDYVFDHCFNKKNKPFGENIFVIQIKTSDYSGYIGRKDDRLICVKEYENASKFSQIMYKKKDYLKIFNEIDWEFLSPHYDLGVIITSWRFSGSINIDMNKQLMVSNVGRTTGYPLCMRLTDKKLYFYKEIKEYQQCQIKIIYIEE